MEAQDITSVQLTHDAIICLETYRDSNNDPKPGRMSSRVRTKTN